MNRSVGRVVSSEDELLILVDSNDQDIGSLSKGACHDGLGSLHRAFSIFLFNMDGELLLQQRSPGKRLWPMYWSNTICSHPRHGETMEYATVRRLEDELQTTSNLEFVYKFEYQTEFGFDGSENELCHVFLGRLNGEPTPNKTEIAAIRYLPDQDLVAEFRRHPEVFTPWFKMEWSKLSEDYPELLRRYTVPV